MWASKLLYLHPHKSLKYKNTAVNARQILDDQIGMFLTTPRKSSPRAGIVDHMYNLSILEGKKGGSRVEGHHGRS